MLIPRLGFWLVFLEMHVPLEKSLYILLAVSVCHPWPRLSPQETWGALAKKQLLFVSLHAETRGHS